MKGNTDLKRDRHLLSRTSQLFKCLEQPHVFVRIYTEHSTLLKFFGSIRASP